MEGLGGTRAKTSFSLQFVVTFKHRFKISHPPIECSVIFNSSSGSIEIFLNPHSVIKNCVLFL